MDEPQADDASRLAAEHAGRDGVAAPSTSGNGDTPSGYSATGRSGAGHGFEREPRVDHLVDGLMGGSSSTTLGTPTVHSPSSIRTPTVWPPRPTNPPPLFPPSAPAPAGPFVAPPQQGGSSRFGRRVHRPGNWTHRGLRRGRHIIFALVIAGALVAAAVITTQSLAASASTNFPGVLLATQPIYLNFVGQGQLSSVDVAVNEPVAAGQLLATQVNSTQAAAVVRDNILLASDTEALADLLGTSGKAAAAQAAALLGKAQTTSAADEQRGSVFVDEGLGQLSAAQGQLTADVDQLNAANSQLTADKAALAAAQATYASQCPSGKGPGCPADARAVAHDQTAVALTQASVGRDQTGVGLAQARVNTAQTNYTHDEGLDATLTTLASQVEQSAGLAVQSQLPTLIEAIRLARAAVTEDQYQLTLDEGALGASNLVAPTAGTVVAVGGSEGEIVGPGGGHDGSTSQTPVVPQDTTPANDAITPSSTNSATVTTPPFITLDAAGLEATAQVPEAQIPAIYVGERAQVSVNALSGKAATLQGKVSSIGLQPVLVNGDVYYDVTVVPANGTWSGKLYAGMTTNVSIP
jgi:multidrug efflux pump subunit AcrA (membrane-fusion protein)